MFVQPHQCLPVLSNDSSAPEILSDVQDQKLLQDKQSEQAHMAALHEEMNVLRAANMTLQRENFRLQRSTLTRQQLAELETSWISLGSILGKKS